jgi:hypothetical protein
MDGYFRKIFWAIIFVISFFIEQSCNRSQTGLSTYEELKESIIVVDSIKLKNNNYLFWYCNDLGIQGYSSGKIGLAKKRNELEDDSKFITISEDITGIKLLSPDTLQISFFSDDGFSGNIQNGDYFQYIKLKKEGGYKDLIIYRIEHK